jgi:ATP-dependent Lon protease
MIADIDGDFQDVINVNTPSSVPILPVRNLVLFPGVVSPILIGRDSSKIVIQKAEKKGEIIGII